MSRDNPEWFPDRDMSSRPYQGDKPEADATLWEVGIVDDPKVDVPGALRVDAARAKRRGQFAKAAKLEKQAKEIERNRLSKAIPKAPVPAKPAPAKLNVLPKTAARISARPTGRGAKRSVGGFGFFAYLAATAVFGGVIYAAHNRKGRK